MQQIFIYSPLEQFQVFPILSFYLLGHDFSITNETIIFLLVLSLTLGFFSSLFQKVDDSTLDLIPKRRQSILEIIYSSMLSLVIDNIKDKNSQKYFPLVFSLFLFILSLNLLGLIPYSFTLTSHLIVTFFISLSIFIGINIICAKMHGIRMFALFLPSGTSVLLAFLLVPIELISYIFKPVSLSIRLFANMMAGHTLLKVIAGFAYVLMGNGGLLFLIQYVPLLILIPLFGLELGVALIQSFVFSILICIYLNDSINLH
jgi:ATP synthase subunit 6